MSFRKWKQVMFLLTIMFCLMGSKKAAMAAGTDGFIVDEDGTLLSYTGSETEVTVPDTVITIGADAFKGNTSIQKVILSGKVISIEEEAFYGCKALTYVKINSDVTEIGENTFAGASKVKVYIKKETSYLSAYFKSAGITYYICESHTVTYRLDGGTNDKQNPTTYTTGTKVVLSKPVRTGYTFGGWYSDSKFTKKVTQINETDTSDMVLYAKWNVVTYKISYNVKGGTNSSKNVTSYTVATKTFSLKTPTRSGYYFVGWYNGTKKVTSIKKGTAGAIKLTAKWSKYNKKVYLKSNTTVYKTSAATSKQGTAVKNQMYYSASVTVGKYTPVMNVATNKTGFIQTKKLTTTKPTTDIVRKTKQYYDYSTMKSNLTTLAKTYPQWMSVSSLGKTYDKREIYCVTIGNPDADKQIVVTASMHAREYLNTYMFMDLIEYYMNNYQSKADKANITYEKLFDEVCLYIVPMVNPDGVQIAQYGVSGLNSKTLQTRVKKILNGKSHTTWKNNARGVNLNRNFPASWAKITDSNRPDATTYAGTSAGSEKETQAIIKLYESLSNPVASLAYHSMGNLVDWNVGKNNKYYDITMEMASAAKKLTGYSYPGVDLTGGVGGTMGTWLSQGKFNMPSLTIETGSVACPLPMSQYSSIWNKNKYVVEVITKMFY